MALEVWTGCHKLGEKQNGNGKQGQLDIFCSYVEHATDMIT